MGQLVNSAAEYAASRRERGLTGVSRQAVENALADGRIHREPDGTIDVDRADREWEQNTDPVRRSAANEQLSKARAAEATVKARRAQLELEKLQGQLVEAKVVERRWFELTRRTRDRLLTVAARVSGQVAQENDPRVIERLIDREIRDCLSGLTGGEA